MKRLVAILAMCLACTQIYGAEFVPSANVKFNVAATTITVYNPSFELGFAPHSSLTLDYVGIFSGESWMGTDQPLLFSMGVIGYRYNFDANNSRGFYMGAELGADSFKMNKNNAFFIANDSGGDRYDIGNGFVAGAVFGYKFPVSPRLSLDVNASFGWHYALHEVYVDGVLYVERNPTAEWLPYKAGLYLSYRLW